MSTTEPAIDMLVARLEMTERRYRKLLIVGASLLLVGAIIAVLASKLFLAGC